MFCVGDAALSFDVDEDEIVGAGPKHGEPFGVGQGRLDVEAGEAENLVAERAEHLAATDVQDGAFTICDGFHMFSLRLRALARTFTRRLGRGERRASL